MLTPQLTLFPYTTLFRSKAASWTMTPLRDPIKNIVYNATAEDVDRVYVGGRLVVDQGRVLAADEAKILADLRSEEHTSELQSHVNLVCRLLLEKKKYRAS